MHRLVWAVMASLASSSPSAAGCAEESQPCQMGDRTYHIALPEAFVEGAPALIYLHGYGGSGESAMRNKGVVEGALSRGYAVVTPTGLPMGNGRNGFRWAFRGADAGLEMDFLKALRTDLSTRFGIDPDRTLLAGFSNGAFMVAYLACADPDAYPAYAAIAGGFWRPHPEGCEGPVRLHATHGWTDGVVPIEGRILRGGSRDADGAIVQGDIFRTLEIFRVANGCRRNTPEDFEMTEQFWTRTWVSCAEGSALEFSLHQGGHGVPRGWTDLALDWFEKL